MAGASKPPCRNFQELAAVLIRQAVLAEGCTLRPLVLHADNGSPMKRSKVNVWFRPPEDHPAFFAGIWTTWTTVRKLKDGETTDDLFGFLTCAPNADVREVHPKVMPVILTEPDEWETWLSAPWAEAAARQRALPDGVLRMGGQPTADRCRDTGAHVGHGC